MLEHRWYTIQTTSGHENKVQRMIQRKIDMDSATPEDRLIRQALVPTQEVVEIKNGKKVTVERKIFPGYVLVDMVASQDTLHEINAIQGVIKFVGKEKEPKKVQEIMEKVDRASPVRWRGPGRGSTKTLWRANKNGVALSQQVGSGIRFHMPRWPSCKCKARPFGTVFQSRTGTRWTSRTV